MKREDLLVPYSFLMRWALDSPNGQIETVEHMFTRASEESPGLYINHKDLSNFLEDVDGEPLEPEAARYIVNLLKKKLLSQHGLMIHNKRSVGYKIASPTEAIEEIAKSILRAFSHSGSALRTLGQTNINIEEMKEENSAAYNLIELSRHVLLMVDGILNSETSCEIKQLANELGLDKDIGAPVHLQKGEDSKSEEQ